MLKCLQQKKSKTKLVLCQKKISNSSPKLCQTAIVFLSALFVLFGRIFGQFAAG